MDGTKPVSKHNARQVWHACVCVCQRESLCVSVCLGVCLCLCVFMFASLSKCVYVQICNTVWLCAYVCVHPCVYTWRACSSYRRKKPRGRTMCHNYAPGCHRENSVKARWGGVYQYEQTNRMPYWCQLSHSLSHTHRLLSLSPSLMAMLPCLSLPVFIYECVPVR